MTFDKTGTLTTGEPQVVAVCPADSRMSADGLLALAAVVEKRSEHPLGRAIVRACVERTGAEAEDPDSFLMVPGRGVVAEVAGLTVCAGNAELLAARGQVVSPEVEEHAAWWRAEGATVVYLGWDGAAAGCIALSDRPRESGGANACSAAGNRCGAGFANGDQRAAAAHVAAELGITAYRAACLPEDKLAYIDESERAGKGVCMVGDGSTMRRHSSAHSWASQWAASGVTSRLMLRTSFS